jgi:2-polyprenyl-3-methyl-5-hydroxy-6-metoxy-1,4-benzoquinol methylase
MTAQKLDQAKAEAFAEKMLGLLNGASLAIMTSIGHRTGLFDTLAGLPPSTSEQIAKAAGLNERYVREWLGAMVTGRIIDYEPVSVTYYLLPEHAPSLTRAAASDNLAMFMQYIALLGNVEDRIVECFRNGGGVPYSAYPRFQQLMAEESDQTVAAALVDTILPLAPGLVEALGNGMDVLDVGCGHGNAINVMAKVFPNSKFTGYDFSEEGIAAARAEAKQKGLSNVRFEVKDVAGLNEPGRYGLITAFDAIHDQAQPTKVLRSIANALRTDGIFLMADIRASSYLEKNLGHPLGPFLYTASCMHCMTVSLALNGEGLGTMWGEEKARQMLADAGFTSVELKQLPHDIQNNYYIATKS